MRTASTRCFRPDVRTCLIAVVAAVVMFGGGNPHQPLELTRSTDDDLEPPAPPAISDFHVVFLDVDDDSCNDVPEYLVNGRVSPTTDDAVAWIVYRDGEAVGAWLGPSNEFVDIVRDPGRYCYELVAVDQAGNESIRGESACVDVEMSCGCTSTAPRRGGAGSIALVLGLFVLHTLGKRARGR